MKKIIVSLILSSFAATMLLADEIQLPHITVYGTATTEVVPDQMMWSVNVRNTGSALQIVADDHTKLVRAIIKFLKESKLEEKDIQTSRMGFGENKEYKASSWVKMGYFATTDISFKVKDLDAYQKLWLGLSKIEGVSVGDVAYDHTKRIAYQNETRIKAVLAAKEKATTLAKAVGSEIGEPLLVEEDLSINNLWAGNALVNNRVESGNQTEPSETLAPGTIPIKIRVKASFRLITTQK